MSQGRSPADEEARARVVALATRQAYVKQIDSTRRSVLLGAALMVGGFGIFAAAIYAALLIGQVSVAGGGIGFLMLVIGGAKVAGALAGRVAARRRLREHDERALPAARVVRE